MGLFGLSTKKEVERREAEARQSGMRVGQESVIHRQQSSLSNLGRGSQVKFSVLSSMCLTRAFRILQFLWLCMACSSMPLTT